jgi:predicted metal-binding membrane protein
MATIGVSRPARFQWGLLASLLAAAIVAWIVTRQRMLGMDAGPGTDPGSLGFYVVSWVVMMSAMMFPSIAPMVLTFGYVQRRRRDRGAIEHAISSWLFVGGYLIAWTVFGLLAYGLFVGVRSMSIGGLSWHQGGRYVASGVLVAAAIYQLTPAKDACLRRCRGPLDFIMTQWREGSWGAVQMGLLHGAWCAGCCWALMAALFALGVMSIPWMIVIAGMIALEKLLPLKVLANRVIALALVVLGIGIAFAPTSVPGLTLPGSPAAMRAMRAMHGTMTMRGTTAMPAMKHGPATSSAMPGR